jgi:hypothetical protein
MHASLNHVSKGMMGPAEFRKYARPPAPHTAPHHRVELLTPERRTPGRMKSSAYFLNMSRGMLVQEAALAAALAGRVCH